MRRVSLRYTNVNESIMELSIDFEYIGAMYLIKGMRGDEKDVYLFRIETKAGKVHDISLGSDKAKATEEFHRVEHIWLMSQYWIG